MHNTVLIVAMDEAGGIGIGGRLPWDHPEDLRSFKARTLGHALIMGRTTFDSIGLPLPGREVHVVSRSMVEREGVHVHGSPEAALTAAMSRHETVFVAGGAQIYQALFDACNVVERTIIAGRHECDAWLDLDLSGFQLIGTEFVTDQCLLERWRRR